MTIKINSRPSQSSPARSMADVKAAYQAARSESQSVRLSIAQRLAASERADALRLVWRQLRDERDAQAALTVTFTRTDSPQVVLAARGCTQAEAADLVAALLTRRHIASAQAV